MIEAVCRACGRHDNLKDLDLCGDGVLQKLLICASISISEEDVLPKVICSDCEEDLDFCYRFRVRAIETEQNLRQLLTRIKLNQRKSSPQIEDEDDGDVDADADVDADGGSSPENILSFEENERKVFVENGVKTEGLEVNSVSSFEELSNSAASKMDIANDMVDPEVFDRKQFIVATTFENMGEELICLEETEDGIKSLDEDEDRKDILEFQEMENWTDNNSINEINNGKQFKEDLVIEDMKNIEEMNDLKEEPNDELVEILSSDDEEEQRNNQTIENFKALINIADDNGDDEDDEFEDDTNADFEAEDFFFLDDDTDVKDEDLTLKPKEVKFNGENEEISHSSLYVKNEDELANGNESKVNVSNYTCPTCHEEVRNHAEYREHVKGHGNKRFNCDKCEMWFSTPCRLKIHLANHSTATGRISCEICSNTYMNKKNLSRHVKKHHPNNPLSTCTICGLNVGLKERLPIHMNTHVKANLSCSKCLKNFKNKRNLRNHMKLHFEREETERKAKEKGKEKDKEKEKAKEKDKEKEKEKEKVKDKEKEKDKTYYCVHCGKLSDTFLDHKNHFRSHYKELPFKCDICERAFSTMAALIAHEYSHADNRPYQCEHCLMNFRQAVHLNEHKKVHLTNFPYKCEICGLGFDKQNYFNIHLKNHEGDAPRKCPHCDETFTLNALLIKHCRDVHKIKIETDITTPSMENRTDYSSPSLDESKEFYTKCNGNTNSSDDPDNSTSLRRKSSISDEPNRTWVKRRKS